MPIVEYPHGTAFPGVIGRTTDESSPAWPAPIRAAQGAPNVLFVVLDDTGFGNLGCFGSTIATPNFDRIAGNGLRYTSMHTTALCSPSRSCIITGRNHHRNGLAAITELATGYPGYNGIMPFENGMLSEMLLEHPASILCLTRPFVAALALRPCLGSVFLKMVDDDGDALVVRTWRTGYGDGEYELARPSVRGTDLILRPGLFARLHPTGMALQWRELALTGPIARD